MDILDRVNAGDAIRRARIDAGLTQHALAALAGTSQATISAYESGRKQPSVETLERVLAAAGARLAVVPRRARARRPTRGELARAGRMLKDVMGLAEALPVDDPQVRQPDISRARDLLDWEPEIDLREGLRRTIEAATAQLAAPTTPA